MSKTTVSLVEYIRLYELDLAYQGKTQSTLRVYINNLNRVCRYLEESLERQPVLSDLTPEAVMAYAAAMPDRPKYQGHPFKPAYVDPISPFSLDQRIRTLKGFATWLHEKRYTRQNVLKLLERPKTPKLTVDPLSDDEIKRILASVNTKTFQGARDYALLVFLLDTVFVPAKSAA